ncbi:MAG: hypothetical protein AAFN91_07610 [Pseudomonadota bacterium]
MPELDLTKGSESVCKFTASAASTLLLRLKDINNPRRKRLLPPENIDGRARHKADLLHVITCFRNSKHSKLIKIWFDLLRLNHAGDRDNRNVDWSAHLTAELQSQD